jgi:hypothetical protein
VALDLQGEPPGEDAVGEPVFALQGLERDGPQAAEQLLVFGPAPLAGRERQLGQEPGGDPPLGLEGHAPLEGPLPGGLHQPVQGDPGIDGCRLGQAEGGSPEGDAQGSEEPP